MTGPITFALIIMSMVFFYSVFAVLLTMAFCWAWSDGFDEGYRMGRASMEDHNDR